MIHSINQMFDHIYWKDSGPQQPHERLEMEPLTSSLISIS